MYRRLMVALAIGLSLFLVSCGDEDAFTKQGTTQLFAQDYNPELLDILWVINDRSPMNAALSHIVAEAKDFFARLDGMTSYYRMGIVTTDMQFAKGSLQPKASPIILEKNFGTVEERAGVFGALLSHVVNLKTGGEDKGFEAAATALQSGFPTRPGVPLVLVFVSDDDDDSASGDNPDAVDFYTKKFLAIKNNDKKLIRAYSINLTPLAKESDRMEKRCTASKFNAEIDSTATTQPSLFQNRYFRLAQALSVDQPNPALATADLCTAFADNINLAGLKLTEPKKKFLLATAPRPGSLTVAVVLDGQLLDLKWTFDSSENAILFDEVPPDGSVVQATYFTE